MGRYADGRLAVFVRGSNGAVYENRHQFGGGSWTGWASLGGWIGNNPAVGQFADGRLVIFVQGTNSAPYLKWQVAPNGAWTEWVLLGGVRSGAATSSISVGTSTAVFNAPQGVDETPMPEAPADTAALPDVAE